jgi:hypothetical protein
MRQGALSPNGVTANAAPLGTAISGQSNPPTRVGSGSYLFGSVARSDTPYWRAYFRILRGAGIGLPIIDSQALQSPLEIKDDESVIVLRVTGTGYMPQPMFSATASETNNLAFSYLGAAIDGAGEDESPEIAMARARSRAYAERIEFLWDTDPAMRARIELGLAQLAAGEGIPFSVDAAMRKQREKRRPS